MKKKISEMERVLKMLGYIVHTKSGAYMETTHKTCETITQTGLRVPTEHGYELLSVYARDNKVYALYMEVA